MNLKEKYNQQTGESATNSQGEPDIRYVKWLEEKVNDQKINHRCDCSEEEEDPISILVCTNCEKSYCKNVLTR